MADQIKSRTGVYASFNISDWDSIPDGQVFTRPVDNTLKLFYVNNTTDEKITSCSGQGPEMEEDKALVLLPGWNEYILKSITVPEGVTGLQWGE